MVHDSTDLPKFLFNFQGLFLQQSISLLEMMDFCLFVFSKSQICFLILCHFLNGSELFKLILHFNTAFYKFIDWTFLKLWILNFNLFFLMGRFCCGGSYFGLCRMGSHFLLPNLSLPAVLMKVLPGLPHPVLFPCLSNTGYIRYSREETMACFSWMMVTYFLQPFSECPAMLLSHACRPCDSSLLHGYWCLSD